MLSVRSGYATSLGLFLHWILLSEVSTHIIVQFRLHAQHLTALSINFFALALDNEARLFRFQYELSHPYCTVL